MTTLHNSNFTTGGIFRVHSSSNGDDDGDIYHTYNTTAAMQGGKQASVRVIVRGDHSPLGPASLFEVFGGALVVHDNGKTLEIQTRTQNIRTLVEGRQKSAKLIKEHFDAALNRTFLTCYVSGKILEGSLYKQAAKPYGFWVIDFYGPLSAKVFYVGDDTTLEELHANFPKDSYVKVEGNFLSLTSNTAVLGLVAIAMLPRRTIKPLPRAFRSTQTARTDSPPASNPRNQTPEDLLADDIPLQSDSGSPADVSPKQEEEGVLALQ